MIILKNNLYTLIFDNKKTNISIPNTIYIRYVVGIEIIYIKTR